MVERSLEGREDGTEGHRAAGEQLAGPIHKLEEGGQGWDGEKMGGLHRTTLGNLTLHSRLAQPPCYTEPWPVGLASDGRLWASGCGHISTCVKTHKGTH